MKSRRTANRTSKRTNTQTNMTHMTANFQIELHNWALKIYDTEGMTGLRQAVNGILEPFKKAEKQCEAISAVFAEKHPELIAEWDLADASRKNFSAVKKQMKKHPKFDQAKTAAKDAAKRQQAEEKEAAKIAKAEAREAAKIAKAEAAAKKKEEKEAAKIAKAEAAAKKKEEREAAKAAKEAAKAAKEAAKEAKIEEPEAELKAEPETNDELDAQEVEINGDKYWRDDDDNIYDLKTLEPIGWFNTESGEIEDFDEDD